jgi:hypothetical protein
MTPPIADPAIAITRIKQAMFDHSMAARRATIKQSWLRGMKLSKHNR